MVITFGDTLVDSGVTPEVLEVPLSKACVESDNTRRSKLQNKSDEI